MSRILVIEDDPAILRGLADNLKFESHEVLTAADGEAGYRLIHEQHPDLIILDLMLPKLSGYEVCRKVRDEGITTPIMMLTARGEEGDRVLGLDLGADDYVTKPFSPREIVLRIRAILRRVETPGESLKAGPISIDAARHEVRVNGKQVHLTSLEFKLLQTLMQRRGRVQNRDRLLNEVWGYEAVIDTRTVDTHVRRLREKLGKAGDAIETVRGFGYRVREN